MVLLCFSYRDFFPLLEYTSIEKEGLATITKVVKAKLCGKSALLRKADRKLGYLPMKEKNTVQNPNRFNFTRKQRKEITETLDKERKLLERERKKSFDGGEYC